MMIKSIKQSCLIYSGFSLVSSMYLNISMMWIWHYLTSSSWFGEMLVMSWICCCLLAAPVAPQLSLLLLDLALPLLAPLSDHDLRLGLKLDDLEFLASDFCDLFPLCLARWVFAVAAQASLDWLVQMKWVSCWLCCLVVNTAHGIDPIYCSFVPWSDPLHQGDVHGVKISHPNNCFS